MAEKTLQDLFLHTLKDVYYAEKQVLRALPRMAKAATSEELRRAFEHHRTETEHQIERLEQVFGLLGKNPHGVPCEAFRASSRLPRRSSTTRSPDTGPSRPGLTSLA